MNPLKQKENAAQRGIRAAAEKKKGEGTGEA